MDARSHQIQHHTRQRSGQGAGTKHRPQECKHHPSRFCPICGYRFGKDVQPVTVYLDRKSAAVPKWIPKHLDRTYVAICDDFCAPVILTGHFRREVEPDEILQTNCTFQGDDLARVGEYVCKYCGDPVSYGAHSCIPCANFIKGKQREAKNRKAKQEARA